MNTEDFKLGVEFGRMVRPEIGQSQLDDFINKMLDKKEEALPLTRTEKILKQLDCKEIVKELVSMDSKISEEIEKGEDSRKDSEEEIEQEIISKIPVSSIDSVHKYKNQFGQFIDVHDLVRRSIPYKIKDVNNNNPEYEVLICDVQYSATERANIMREVTTLTSETKKEQGILINDKSPLSVITNPKVNDFDPDDKKVPEELKDFILEDKDHKYGEQFFDPKRDSFAGTLSGGREAISESDAIRKNMRLIPLEKDSKPLKIKGEKKVKEKLKKLKREESKEIFKTLMGWFNELPKGEILKKRMINLAFPELVDKRIEMIKWALNGAGYLQNTGVGYFKMVLDIPVDSTYMTLLAKMSEMKLNKEQQHASSASEGSNTGSEVQS